MLMPYNHVKQLVQPHTLLPSSAVCRLRFLPVPVFAALSAALFGWLLYIMVSDARAKGLAHPLASYPDVYGFGRAAAA